MADLLRQAEQGQPVQLTLSGEHSAQTFHTAPLGLVERIQRFFKAPALYGRARAAMKIVARNISPRTAWALSKQAYTPCSARLYAARGVQSKDDELDDGADRPPAVKKA